MDRAQGITILASSLKIVFFFLAGTKGNIVSNNFLSRITMYNLFKLQSSPFFGRPDSLHPPNHLNNIHALDFGKLNKLVYF